MVRFRGCVLRTWRSETGDALAQRGGPVLRLSARRVVGALIDTACGFAAATLVGPRLLAAHFSVNCLRPAFGQRFVARARVIKPGKQQVFTSCELFAIENGVEKLVATGETLLTVLQNES